MSGEGGDFWDRPFPGKPVSVNRSAFAGKLPPCEKSSDEPGDRRPVLVRLPLGGGVLGGPNHERRHTACWQRHSWKLARECAWGAGWLCTRVSARPLHNPGCPKPAARCWGSSLEEPAFEHAPLCRPQRPGTRPGSLPPPPPGGRRRGVITPPFRRLGRTLHTQSQSPCASATSRRAAR